MGKGDRKTKRGKIHLGTFGKLRRPLENKHKAKSDESSTTEKS